MTQLAEPIRGPKVRRSKVGRSKAGRFKVGTTGWTVDDLSDPAVQEHWSQGRYELVDGVITEMAPQGFGGVRPLSRLRRVLEDRLRPADPHGYFYNEVDLRLPNRRRVPKPDMLYLTGEQDRRQGELERERGIRPGRYTPVLVVPLLVVESLSVGHEDHDRRTKRAWYARAGVPHYWLLNDADRSLRCLALDGPRYRDAGQGRGAEGVRTELFDLTVSLAEVWG